MQHRKYYGYTQLLFIPSDCDSIAVDSKEYFDFFMYCNIGQDISGGAFWTIAGHREQLFNYDSLQDALQSFYLKAEVSMN